MNPKEKRIIMLWLISWAIIIVVAIGATTIGFMVYKAYGQEPLDEVTTFQFPVWQDGALGGVNDVYYFQPANATLQQTVYGVELQ